LDEKASRRIISFHYLLALLILISILLEITDNLSFSGQWTTRIIIIGFLLTGTFIFPVTNWGNKLKIEKFYFRIFSLFPILTFLFSLIPFLGIVAVLSCYGQLTDPVKNIYYEDERIRIQSSFVGVLGPPRLFVYQKKGILERQLATAFKSAADMDSVSIDNGKDNMLIVMYEHKQVMDTLKIVRVE